MADSADALTSQVIQDRVANLQTVKDIDAPTLEQALELYRKAEQNVKSAASWADKSAEYGATEREAPAKLADLNAQLTQETQQASTEVPADASLAQCESMLNECQAELSAARRDSNALEQEPKRRAERRQEISGLLTAGAQNLQEFRDQLAAAAPSGEHPELSLARKTLVQSQERLLRRQLGAYRREMKSYDASAALLTAQRDLADHRLLRAQQASKAWQEMLAQRRKEQAHQTVQKAIELTQDQLAASVPAVCQLAQDNADLAGQRISKEGFAARLEGVSAELDRTTATLRRLREAHKNTAERVRAGGNSDIIASLLRKQRADLRDVQLQQRKVSDLQVEISAAQMKLMDMEDQRSQLDLDARTAEILSTLPSATTQQDRQALERTVRELLINRRVYIEDLVNDCNAYLAKLLDLDTSRTRLLREMNEFARFIDERVLWIRSTSTFGASELTKASIAIGALLRSETWARWVSGLMGGFANHFGITLLGGLLFGGLVTTRHWVGKRLAGTEIASSQTSVATFRAMIVALLLTLFMGASIPVVISLAAWRLESQAGGNDGVRGLAAGMQAVAAMLLIVGILRQVCRPGGLAQKHFLWPQSSVRALRTALGWLLAMGLPLAFLLAAVESQGVDSLSNSLGRLVFIVAMVALALFMHAILYPNRPVMKESLSLIRGGWLDRLRYFWYVLAIGFPLLLAAIAAGGYYYTALQLSWRLQATAWLILILLLANAVLLRWLRLARRRIDLAKLAAAGKQDAMENPASAASNAAAEAATTHVRSRHFVKFLIVTGLVLGAWLIWRDVSPAFDAVGNVPLWTHTVKVTPSAGASGLTGLTEKVVPVTIGDILLALAVAALAYLAGKDIPSLLEIMVFAPLRWTLGARYAFSTILRYVISVIASVIILGLLGISWAGVQWLVAAVTVGLGFGLQEIFANFVSGLILLFERPIRVGDVVTVGNVTGTVSRIRIRATTITDMDRKELVVPNKEFITRELVNWTLSDTVLRVVVPVGIAYGSDVQKASDLLLAVAKANRMVMDKPAPVAYFMSFGDSCLQMELRVFVRDMDSFHLARHQLQIAIDQAFRKAGIEIPFPQRDINIRSFSGPLPIAPQGGDRT